MGDRPLAARVYARCLWILPRDLRDEHGAEAARLYEDLHRDARARGRAAAGLLLVRSLAGLAVCAVAARREGIGGGAGGARRMNGHRKGGEVMSGFLHDLRYAIRALAKSPGFALTAILILGAGIGATTTIFSVVDTVVLRALPYPDAGRLVHFDEGAHNYPSFRAWLDLESFEMVSAARGAQVDLTGDGPPERIRGAEVSRDFFRLLGGAPYLGRLFGPDDHPGTHDLTVLSHGLWTRLGADESLIGRSITLDGRPSTVIGVLDPDFVPPELETGSRVDVWFALDNGGEMENDHGYHVLGVVARLKPGVALEAAQAEVDAQRTAFAEEHPEQYYGRDGSLWRVPVVEMHEATVRDVRGMLFLLFGAVGMMLLIACANVANLFLARGTARGREIALRGALGASRVRIAGQILEESVIVSLLGGAFGVLLAFGGVDLLARSMPDGLPRIDRLAVDLRVLWFTVGVSVLTGVLFGTFPAVQALRDDVNDALKDGAGTVSASRRGRRTRNVLVISEVALAVVLVAGAGLLLRSFVARVTVDPGFRIEQLVTMRLDLEAGYDEPTRLQFVDALTASIRRMPGTQSVATGWATPFTWTGAGRCCWRTPVVGDPTLVDEESPFRSIIHPVSDEYFATLGAPLHAGREFDRKGADAERQVAILNRPAAEDLFGTSDPVGRSIELGGESLEVVGVVEGVHHWGLTEEIEAGVYVPYDRYGPEFGMLEVAVRTDAPADVVAQRIREAVWDVDPDLPIGTVVTMESKVAASLATPRFLSGLLGAFALVALLLACGGIYGSMLYNVGQRRHEMGIRMALGARGSDVVGLVVRQGTVLAVVGVAIGIVAALGLSDFMERLVWGVEPTDPVTFVSAAVILGGTAILASLLPAWRASRTDPLQTLKAE